MIAAGNELLEAGRRALASGDPAAAALAFEQAFIVQPALIDAYRSTTVSSGARELSLLAHSTIRDNHMRRYAVTLEPLEDLFGSPSLQRVHAFTRIFHGFDSVPVMHPMQKPSYHAFPGLRAQAWWDATTFSWSQNLIQAASQIRSELEAALSAAPLQPYVPQTHTEPGWETLRGRLTWGSLHLLKAGRTTDHAPKFSRTISALKSLPLAEIEGQAPEAFFSVLQPGTRIPPHTGLANTKLTVHLPLSVNSECMLSVGGEARAWVADSITLFDDSFVHEACNLGQTDRIVLITEIWHPELSAAERQGLSAVVASYEQWQADVRATVEA